MQSQILFLLTKSRVSFILIYKYLHIMSHVNLRSKFCSDSKKFLTPPLIISKCLYFIFIQ